MSFWLVICGYCDKGLLRCGNSFIYLLVYFVNSRSPNLAESEA